MQEIIPADEEIDLLVQVAPLLAFQVFMNLQRSAPGSPD